MPDPRPPRTSETRKTPKPPVPPEKREQGAGEILVPAPAKAAAKPHGGPNLEEKIRRGAYELYEARGGEPGREVEDWLRAEREILGRASGPEIRR